MFDAHGDKDESMWQEIMREVDKNHDNVITFDEFAQVMNAMLKKEHIK